MTNGIGNTANQGNAMNRLQTDEPELIEAKIVLIGDMAVGKSSLAGRFNHGNFEEIYQNTIGGAYFRKVMLVPDPEYAS